MCKFDNSAEQQIPPSSAHNFANDPDPTIQMLAGLLEQVIRLRQEVLADVRKVRADIKDIKEELEAEKEEEKEQQK